MKTAHDAGVGRWRKRLRWGARTPILCLRGEGISEDLSPRRRGLSRSLPSEAVYGVVCLLAASCMTATSLSASPLASKDTVQVQTALSAAGSSSHETNLGDLIADAARQTGSADVAMIAADEIDESKQIPAGKADVGAIVSALHYADDSTDTVVVLNLTGAQLLKAAERSVSRAPQSFDGFMQVSGLQVRYSPSQPEGKRVSLVGVGGAEVSAGKTYRVATTRPVANGSLGYFQIWSAKDVAGDTGISLAKSLTSYLSSHKTITNMVEDRITTH